MRGLLWEGYPHIVQAQQFSRHCLDELIFPETKRMEDIIQRGGAKFLKNKVLATWFAEPSTRTRWTFEKAMYDLGGRVLSSENAEFSSSMKKGESIGDTAEMIQRLRVAAIVMRLREEGAVVQAAERVDEVHECSGERVPRVPVMNAGDGPGQHPSQGLLDLYTAWRKDGTLEGAHFLAVGDMRFARTVRSLVYLSAKYRGVRWTFVSPPQLAMKPDITDYLTRHGVRWEQREELYEVLPQARFVYVTRIQKERFFSDVAAQKQKEKGEDYIFSPEELNEIEREAEALYRSVRGRYVMGKNAFACLARDAYVMHPGPILDGPDSELPREAYRGDRRMIAHRQWENGLYVRACLLKLAIAGV